MQIILTKSQQARKDVIQRALKKQLSNRRAAIQLNISERQFYNLKKKYKLYGDQSLIHGNTGRKPATAIPQELRDEIIAIAISNTYKNSTYQYLSECLLEDFDTDISKTTVAYILKAQGITSPCRHKSARESEPHPYRPRREHFGELLQADASPYDWLSTGKLYSFHAFIDDATGMITGGYLSEHECLMGYNEVLKQTLLKYGIPEQLYPDRAGIFFVPDKEQKNLSFDEQLQGKTGRLTQFGRIAQEFGIDMFPAYSPQAKGRIERSWRTHQLRLPIWFRRHGVKTLEEANKLLPEYLKEFNKKFGKKPQSSRSSFVKLTKKQRASLDMRLVAQYPRHTDKGGRISFFNYQFCTDVYDKKVIIKCSYAEKTKKIWVEDTEGKVHDLWLLEDSETDTQMPKVLQNLVEKTFMSDGKRYRPPLPEQKLRRRKKTA